MRHLKTLRTTRWEQCCYLCNCYKCWWVFSRLSFLWCSLCPYFFNQNHRELSGKLLGMLGYLAVMCHNLDCLRRWFRTHRWLVCQKNTSSAAPVELFIQQSLLQHSVHDTERGTTILLVSLLQVGLFSFLSFKSDGPLLIAVSWPTQWRLRLRSSCSLKSCHTHFTFSVQG